MGDQGPGVIAGSPNSTYAGLARNLELEAPGPLPEITDDGVHLTCRLALTPA